MGGIRDPPPSPSPGWLLALPAEQSFLPRLCDSPSSVSLCFAHGSLPLHSWQRGLDFSSCGQWEEANTCCLKAVNLDLQRVRTPQRARDTPGWEWEKGGSVIKAGSQAGIRLQDAVNLLPG